MKSWGTLLGRWEQYQIAMAVPPTTRGLRMYYMRRVAVAFPEGPLTVSFEGLVDWMAEHDWQINTRRSVRTTLRSFWSWLMAIGVAATSPAHLLPSMGTVRARPRPTPENVYLEALASSKPRERLMIRLAAICGLRRGEICKVHSDDIAFDGEDYALHVTGKGGHERWVPLTPELAADLRALPRGWAFPSRQSPTGHLQPFRVGKLVAQALPDQWTCHTLRHRCATVAYAAERDLRAVQELLGHANPNTTAIYVAVPTSSVRRAVQAAAA